MVSAASAKWLTVGCARKNAIDEMPGLLIKAVRLALSSAASDPRISGIVRRRREELRGESRRSPSPARHRPNSPGLWTSNRCIRPADVPVALKHTRHAVVEGDDCVPGVGTGELDWPTTAATCATFPPARYRNVSTAWDGVTADHVYCAVVVDRGCALQKSRLDLAPRRPADALRPAPDRAGDRAGD